MPLAPRPMPAQPGTGRPWLLAPALALAVFLLACSAGWFYARARIDAALDERVAGLRRAGWTAAVDGRRWGGFPFRLKLTVARVALVAPSGWGVEAASMQAEAVIFDPGHWVFAAPQGLTLDRGAAGPLRVRGRALSASVSGVSRRPWRVAAVGEELELAPGPGARPTAFRTIGRWEAYLRPAPDGSGDGEALWQVTDGFATPHTLAWSLAPGAPVALATRARLTRLAAATAGDGWTAQVRAWAAVGGAVAIDRFEARGGPTHVWARGGALSVGPDGRLVGAVPLQIDQTATGAPGEASVGDALRTGQGSTALVFAGGAARLGGLKLGPSPRVY